MTRPFLVVLALAAVAAPTKASCPTLPTGYSYRADVGPHHGDDAIVLTPPYGIRIERHGGGTCQIELSPCGKDNTWTADDVIAAITRPAVQNALAHHARYGAKVANPFVLRHGADSITVGPPCDGCAKPPAEVAATVDMLDKIYTVRIAAECTNL